MKTLLLSIVITCSWLLQPVDAQQFDWGRGGGGTAGDIATAVAVGSDGSVYVGGTFKGSASFGTYSPTITLTANSPYDIDVFVVKYSANGTLIWALSGGGLYDDDLIAIGVDANNVVHIGGQFVSLAQLGTITATGSGGKDVFVATINQTNIGLPTESAQFANVCVLAGPNHDLLRGLAVAPDGSSYITGMYRGTASIGTATSTPIILTAYNGANDSNVYIAKLDINCVPVWVLNAGTVNQDEVYPGLSLDLARNRLFFTGSSNGFLKIGTTQTTVAGQYIAQLDLNGAVGNVKNTYFKTDAITLETNGNLDMLGTGLIRVIEGSTLNQLGTDIVIGLPGNAIVFNAVENAYVVTGPIYRTVTVGSTVLTVPTGDTSTFVAQVSHTGILQWARVVGSHPVGFTTAPKAVAARDGKIFIAGFQTGVATFGSSSHLSAGEYDAYVTRIIPANWISGTVFDDISGDGVQQPGELPRGGVLLQVGTDYYCSRADGIYEIPVGIGSYTITAIPPMYHTSLPTTRTPSFTSVSGGTITGNNFGIHSIPGQNDMRLALTSSPAAPGRSLTYTISLENIGTTVLGSSSLDITFDPLVVGLPVYTSPAGATITGNVVSWTGLSYIPDEHHNYVVRFTLPVTAVIGGTVTTSASITAPPMFVDLTPADNSASRSQIIVASYDPNDKLVLPDGNMTPTQVAASPWLNYIIRFQNTGTGQAYDVVLRDTLSRNLDWSTLQTLGSSHAYTLEATGHGAVAWRFSNINLIDSGANESASHGFVTYRIKPKSTLAIGDSIANWASIYFDYNTPVVTKKVVTIVTQRPPITRNDTLTGRSVMVATAHITANEYRIRNRKLPVSPITAVDLQIIPPPPVPPLGSNLLIDATATAWSAPFRHITGALAARDSIGFTLGLADTVAYTGALKAIIHHLDGDSNILTYPLSIAGPPRRPDTMTVQAAAFTGQHIIGKTFRIRNAKAPVSTISAIDIRFSPVPRFTPIGQNLAADGLSWIWNAPFTYIPLSPGTRDSLSFDVGLPDSTHWTGVTTLVIHHNDGDSSVLTYGPWTADRLGIAQGFSLPSGFGLTGVQPNPVSMDASVEYTVGISARVRLDVVNSAGQMVMQIEDRSQSAGSHRALIPVHQLAPGTYWVRMSSLGGTAVMPMVVIR